MSIPSSSISCSAPTDPPYPTTSKVSSVSLLDLQSAKPIVSEAKGLPVVSHLRSPLHRPRSRVEMEADLLRSTGTTTNTKSGSGVKVEGERSKGPLNWMGSLWRSSKEHHESNETKTQETINEDSVYVEGLRTVVKDTQKSQVVQRELSYGTVKAIVANTDKKYRILMLISDTGGGHRASADALAAAIHHQYPSLCEIEIVDIWTDHGVWPFNAFVPAYKYLCDNPRYWGMLYDYTKSKLSQQFINASGYALCGANFRKVFEELHPNLVCSVHPLCQDVPMKILEDMKFSSIPSSTVESQRSSLHNSSNGAHTNNVVNDVTLQESLSSLSTMKKNNKGLSKVFSRSFSKSGVKQRRVPFVTVVTDLGGAHPTWFHPGVDLCFVPSQAVKALAVSENLKEEQIRLHGLPIRQAFWHPDSRPKELIRKELGLLSDASVCLIVGGGDGVGGIVSLAVELVKGLSERGPQLYQIVVVCGRNENAKKDLEVKLKRFLLSTNGVQEAGAASSSAKLKNSIESLTSFKTHTKIASINSLDFILSENDVTIGEGAYPHHWITVLDDTRLLAGRQRRRSMSYPIMRPTATEDIVHEDYNLRAPFKPSASFHSLGALIPPQDSLDTFPLCDVINQEKFDEIGVKHDKPRQRTQTAEPLQMNDGIKTPTSKFQGSSLVHEEQQGVSSDCFSPIVKGTPEKPRRARRLAQFDLAAVEKYRKIRKALKKRSAEGTPASNSGRRGLSDSLRDWLDGESQNVVVDKLAQQKGKAKLLVGNSLEGDAFTESTEPNVFVVLKGFVNNMADWMAASDVIVTKAGPGTIAEACTRGLPILLNCYLPGQEEGNVHFVTKGRFGGYSSNPSVIVSAACELLSNSKKRKQAAEKAKAAMDPLATCRIADDIVRLMVSRENDHGSRNNAANNNKLDSERGKMIAEFLSGSELGSQKENMNGRNGHHSGETQDRLIKNLD